MLQPDLKRLIFQSYQSGIEIKRHNFGNHLGLIFQSYQSGIEIYLIVISVPGTSHFQSYQSGIEIKVEALLLAPVLTSNRTNLELKYRIFLVIMPETRVLPIVPIWN